jgi:hypothetical protein
VADNHGGLVDLAHRQHNAQNRGDDTKPGHGIRDTVDRMRRGHGRFKT